MEKERLANLQAAVEEEVESSIQKESQYNGTIISPTEAARIRAEVQGVIKQQFAAARANVLAHNKSSNTGNASAENEVIDLITQSVASLQKLQPFVLPNSPISIASTPSQAGNGGSAPGFS